jgi:hypothetical protein
VYEAGLRISARSERERFHIEQALASDWPWLLQGHLEIALVSVGQEPHNMVSLSTVRERIEQQVAWIRGEGATRIWRWSPEMNMIGAPGLSG